MLFFGFLDYDHFLTGNCTILCDLWGTTGMRLYPWLKKGRALHLLNILTWPSRHPRHLDETVIRPRLWIIMYDSVWANNISHIIIIQQHGSSRDITTTNSLLRHGCPFQWPAMARVDLHRQLRLRSRGLSYAELATWPRWPAGSGRKQGLPRRWLENWGKITGWFYSKKPGMYTRNKWKSREWLWEILQILTVTIVIMVVMMMMMKKKNNNDNNSKDGFKYARKTFVWPHID